jgi:hypothetical protein
VTGIQRAIENLGNEVAELQASHDKLELANEVLERKLARTLADRQQLEDQVKQLQQMVTYPPNAKAPERA